MELNRNHYFMIGLIFLFLGLQLRFVKSFTLNEESTRFIQKRILKEQPEPQQSVASLLSVAGPPPASRRQIKPPRWIGFSLLSIGAVLVFHSLSMKKPG